MTTTSDIPGAAFSYADLCAEPHDSEARLMWRALSTFAEVLGLSTTKAQIGARSLTSGELLAEIRDVVPAGLDIAAAAKATLALAPNPPRWTEVYEVHRLVTTDPNVAQWVLHESPFDDYDLAATARDAYEARTGGIYVVVRVQTVTTVEVYPKGYEPRR